LPVEEINLGACILDKRNLPTTDREWNFAPCQESLSSCAHLLSQREHWVVLRAFHGTE